MTTHTTSSSRVLVVEDDEKLASLLCRALRDGGLHAESAFDGVTALRRLTTEPFAAALLDVGLPGLSGLEVCARLRQHGSPIPVIMVSARDSVDDVIAGRQAGATDYLLKPFSLHELTARLDDLVRATAASHAQLIQAGPPHGQLIDAA